MNIVIVGQGAMGLLFYSFAEAALPVLAANPTNPTNPTNPIKLSLLPSKRQMSQPNYLHITDIQGNKNKQLLHYATDETITTADILLLTVKSYQVISALADMAHLISPKTLIILCHNGMGTFEQLPKSFKKNHTIMAMITTHACLRTAPFTIVNTGLGSIDLGFLNEAKHNTDNLIAQVNNLLVNVNFHKNIKDKQWLKLAMNCVINPLTALHDVSNGEIASDKFEQITIKVLQEVVLVAKTQGVMFELESLVEQVKKVAIATKDNSSSMRCDVVNHQTTEIDYINGYIHRLGILHHISTPANTQLWREISALT